ncbi:hypothetical protein AX15_000578 [Amanita polypyramis BW_CC]|nr:hypothetical protein AX15_000578 [Amanita polypyramis BW_CC]
MDAKEPFDSSAKADAILRSSDEVDFFVIKLLLSLTSPLFNDMFSSTHIITDETRNGLPIIRISEDSTTIHWVLLLVYPSYVLSDKPMLHIDNFCRVARVVQKYGMDHIENKLKKIATSPQFLSENAFRVYASAVYLGWTDIATIAAQSTLRTRLCNLPFIDELNIISGADFYSYLVYRYKSEGYTGEGEKPRVIFVRKTPLAPTDDQSSAIADTIADAPSPFNPGKGADAILRSSDGVDFYITKSFLAFLSPAFDSLFMNCNDAPRKAVGTGWGLSVIGVKEDSATLFGLLCFLHPNAEEPAFENFGMFRRIWVAARKYKVSFIAQKLGQSFLSSSYVQEEPLRVFALGINLGCRKVINMAAMNTLAKPLVDLHYADELRYITAANLYRLVEYRFKCVGAVRHLLDNMDTYELLERGHVTRNPQFICEYPVPPYFIAFSIAIRRRLRECPRGSSVMGDDDILSAVFERVSKKGPSECWMRSLLSARRVLASAIDEEVSKVHLGLFFQWLC